jgi:imidazolonepropionase-like amidohydrolase
MAFGVTTVLDMGGSSAAQIDPLRRAAGERAELADIRSALIGLTPADGHPHQLIGDVGSHSWPTATTAHDVPGFVDARIAEGADYLKAWLEDGRLLGHPAPPLDPTLLDGLVEAGHARGRQVLVHALTRATAERAIRAGADGLTHLFVDEPATDDLVQLIARARTYVVPTLSLVASLAGDPSAGSLADEPRVRAVLPSAAADALGRTWGSLAPRHLEQALSSVAALHAGGVTILAGTDASPGVPGIGHGVSLHGELRLLVRAGLSPVEALRAATSTTAQSLGLTDRGRILPGRRADLLLVDGDPTSRIEDTLTIRAVWRGGAASTT